jgi:hypothetical protein
MMGRVSDKWHDEEAGLSPPPCEYALVLDQRY